MKNIFFLLTFFYATSLVAQNGYLPRESFEGAAYRLAVYEVNFEGVQSNGKMRLPYSSVKGSPYFNDEFLTNLSFVVNAVDNIKARQYVDTQCVWYEKPLF
jgi:hypothetical protein